MPTYIFEAKLVQDQTGHVIPLPPGIVARFVLLMPGPNGSFSKDQLVSYARQFRLGSQGINYTIREINHEQLQQPVVVTEISLGGGMTPQANPAQLSGQNIQGGQPTGGPKPQGGVPRTDGPRDWKSGFQPLGDQALDGGVDEVYGETGDYTVSDLYVDGSGTAQEVKRP